MILIDRPHEFDGNQIEKPSFLIMTANGYYAYLIPAGFILLISSDPQGVTA